MGQALAGKWELIVYCPNGDAPYSNEDPSGQRLGKGGLDRERGAGLPSSREGRGR